MLITYVCVYRVKAVGVSFGDVDPFGLEAISKYEEALFRSRREGVPVKALLLCSPHNPLGRCTASPHSSVRLDVGDIIPFPCG